MKECNRRGWRLFSPVSSLAKGMLTLLYLYSGYLPLRDWLLSARGRSRAIVLCYHRIGTRDVLTKPPAEFQRDLEYLKRKFECVRLDELCRRLRANEPIRRPLAVVTFDDGYRDNYTEAAPVLKAVGVPATFFVATGYIGTERMFPHDAAAAGPPHPAAPSAGDYPKLTWDDLRALEADGFEIGSHTVEHTDLGQVDEATLEREVTESLRMLTQELGSRRRAFAYPWGKPSNISQRSIEAVQQAGYYAAVSAYGGSNGRGSSRFLVRRFDAGNGRLPWLALRARIEGLDPDYLRARRTKAEWIG
jgi:peptidoglycan/xylan/chitin deacetylase (PgdA/CDA1 family)